MFTKRADQAIAECEHALALDRNLAHAHAMIGFAKVRLVEAKKPRLTSTRLSAFLRATPRLLVVHDGCRQQGGSQRSSRLDRRGLEANRIIPVAHFLWP